MPKKGENIYKRRDGRWEGRYIKGKAASGKSMYGYVYGKTYRETKAKLIDASANRENAISKSLRNDVLLFNVVAWDWFEHNRITVKLSTSNKYRNLLTKYILPAFENCPISSLSYNMVEDYCQWLLASGGSKQQGLSTKTVADILSVIRNILKFAEKHGINTTCDAASIRIKQSTSEMRVLSRYEQETMCQYLCSDLNSYNIGILMCLYTGLRIGELCALQWEDISLQDHTIHVHRTMQRVQLQPESSKKTSVIITTPKSNCSIRTIPLPTNLVDIISKYRTTSSGYFLTNTNQTFIEPRIMQNKFKKVLDECDIEPANFHALRHTFATRCVEVGFDIKSLSEILGHASVNITMNRYVHPSMELKKENMQRLGNLLAVK